MPGRTTQVDRNALHRLLWADADHRGVVELHQASLADQLEISKFTMSRIIHEFLDDGRIEKLGTAKYNVASYIVVDPDAWHARP